MICGGSGSGKSTLARKVGEITGLPVIHIDPFYWAPGWVQRPSDQTTALITQAAMGETWVFEGNNSKTMQLRADRADLIIYIDMPRFVRMRRVLWRTLRHYGRSRPDMGAGCPERFDPEFIFGWVWNYDRSHRPKMLERLAQWTAEGKPILHLRGKRAVRQFLDDLAKGRYEARHDR